MDETATSPRRKVKMVIAYDGSSYHGWQRQQGGIVTVQETMERSMARVLKHPVTLRAAGRTDTGVHALGAVAHFVTETRIPTDRLAHAINSRLPKDIRVRHCEAVSDDFDAILSSRSKLYRYHVYNDWDMPPWFQRYCHHYWLRTDQAAMADAARQLEGEHDFASFASAGHKSQSTVRTLLRCRLYRKGPWLWFDLEGTGFLYHMVRNIVGTVLEIGRGRWPAEAMSEILSAQDRQAAGPMVPPNGLFLKWVRY